MSYEIEAQVLGINYEKTLEKLINLGAKQKYDWVKFKIAVFYPCLSVKERNEIYDMIFTRVRDEGV